MSLRSIMRAIPSIVFLVSLSAGISAPLWAADPPSPQKSQRTVRFVLREQERSSLTSFEPRLPLFVELSRESSDPEQIFLIAEGPIASHTWVPMTSTPGIWQATLVLDPSLDRQAATKSQGFRIDVSFARVNGMKLQRFLKRSVYVGADAGHTSCSSNRQDNAGSSTVREGFFTPADAHAANPAVRDEPINETHLAGAFTPEGGAAYWWGIKQRIADSWKSNRKRRGLTLQPKTAPRIHFRLYANGIPQIAYLDRSSGHSRIDEAALASVVDAQPFPPFPSGVGRCYMDVRVDLDTAKRR